MRFCLEMPCCYIHIKNDTISHGKAAEMLGIPKMGLIELYGSLGIAYPDDTGGNYCRHKKGTERIRKMLQERKCVKV